MTLGPSIVSGKNGTTWHIKSVYEKCPVGVEKIQRTGWLEPDDTRNICEHCKKLWKAELYDETEKEDTTENTTEDTTENTMEEQPEMYDYSEYTDDPDTSDVLGQISVLVEDQKQLEEEVALLEKQLKRKKSQLSSIAEQELPMLLDQVGVSELTTTNGVKVKVKETIRVSISKEHQNAAMDWLVEHGHGRMIKSEVTAKYNRGQEKLAEQCRTDLIRMLGVDQVSRGRKVEPSTLRAFVKRQLEAGTNIPLELFGVFRQRSTEIK